MWVNVKDNLPTGTFLACWENQGNLMLVCFRDIHGVYHHTYSSTTSDTAGHGNYPKFTHWMPLPAPPTADTVESANLHPPTTAAQNSEA